MTEKTTVITNNKKISDTIKKKLSAAITYFTNQLPRMNYHKYTAQNLPIGSGVIEAACKIYIYEINTFLDKFYIYLKVLG